MIHGRQVGVDITIEGNMSQSFVTEFNVWSASVSLTCSHWQSAAKRKWQRWRRRNDLYFIIPISPGSPWTDSPLLLFIVAEWKHLFSAQCLNVVHDQAFGTRTPNYKAIQELDRKVRNWYMPPSLQVPGFGTATKLASTEVEQPSVQLTMQRYIAFAIKEISQSYFHFRLT